MEERMAWEILAENPSWAVALQALRIDGAQISTAQLSTILSANHLCRELWICKCSTVDREIWKWLGEEWKGREILKILGVLKCDIEIGEKDVDFISGMKALQVWPRLPLSISPIMWEPHVTCTCRSTNPDLLPQTEVLCEN
jgi:hypothetical protein